jgi:hypothetical protein
LNGVAGRVAPGPSNPTATTSTAAPVGTSPAPSSALPPPPPTSLTLPPAMQGVPPTPAPASPGLPSPGSFTRTLPSETGLGSQVENQLRPAASLSAGQVETVQATLAAGGLYRGPIDGVFSGATRASVREFQAIERLPATGELDAETIARLTVGRSITTPVNAGNATLGDGVGSNGTTSTAGNPSTVDPFTGGFSLSSAAAAATTSGTRPTAAQPFPLTAPLSGSPTPPAGTLIQP